MANSNRANAMLRAFGQRLRAARQAAGFNTAAAFAKVLGVEAPRYCKYERGHAMPPIDILEPICVITRTTLDHLAFGHDSDVFLHSANNDNQAAAEQAACYTAGAE